MKKKMMIMLLFFVTSFETTALGAVTRKAPDFHNPGHIRLWNQSALGSFDAHIVTIALCIIIIAGISYFSYFSLKNRKAELKMQQDKEELAFRQLLTKQQAIMSKVIDLEEELEKGQVTEEEYEERLTGFKNYLVKIKMSMKEYI